MKSHISVYWTGELLRGKNKDHIYCHPGNISDFLCLPFPDRKGDFRVHLSAQHEHDTFLMRFGSIQHWSCMLAPSFRKWHIQVFVQSKTKHYKNGYCSVMIIFFSFAKLHSTDFLAFFHSFSLQNDHSLSLWQNDLVWKHIACNLKVLSDKLKVNYVQEEW